MGEYINLKNNFSTSISNNNYDEIKKYMDDTGLFTKFVENKLAISNLNLWNILKYNIDTVGDWNIPNTLQNIQKFLTTSNQAKQLFPNIYRKIDNNNILSKNKYMINDKAWNILAWTQNSYMKGVSLDTLKTHLTIIGGTSDTITNCSGLYEKWKRLNPKTIANNKNNISSSILTVSEKYNDNYIYCFNKGPHLVILEPEYAKYIKNLF